MVKWNRAFVDRPMSEPDQSPRWVRFGTFDVELRTGEIRKQGARFKLQEKLFQVLALLLEHAGRIVTREELRQRLDRKSTRLNSSHLVISYAVFCLKKKNEH